MVVFGRVNLWDIEAIGFKNCSGKTSWRFRPDCRPVCAWEQPVHSAAFNWRNPFGLGHNEAIADPEAGTFSVCVTSRIEVPAKVAGVEGMVRFAPVAGYRAHWILDHVRCLGPFSKPDGGVKELKGLNEGAQALVLKPSGATHCHMGTGWKRKQDVDSCIWRQPFQNVGTHADDIALPVLAGGMLQIDAVAQKARLSPRFDHDCCTVEQAHDNGLNH